GIPPATTFFGEPAPSIDPASWRLRVAGRGGDPSIDLDLPALRELGEVEARAVLDCTSGWAIETPWRGVPLARLVELVSGPTVDPRRAAVVVRSVTGWAASVAAYELDRAVLAWSVAGGPLPAANGAPLRLVLPGHRGLDWVKWVATVEVG
ncbi:MAG: molybdopterin-dependent oxidoreductase, partial [Chloroflexota bacterium]